MDAYRIFFNASDGGHYSVSVQYDGMTVHTLQCDCPAGRADQLCKHIKAFFLKDFSMLYDPNQRPAFADLVTMTAQSPLMAAWQQLENGLRNANMSMDETAATKASFVRRTRGLP